MTFEELADRAGIFWWEADFIMRNPGFIPRLDVQRAIRRALMVGTMWPRSGYGDKCVKQRLKWYGEKQYCAYTWEQIEAMTSDERAVVLEVIELQRRSDLTGDSNE